MDEVLKISVADFFRFRWVFTLIALVAFGCGGNAEEYDTTPVSGVVTCQGKPVANATVNFTPMKAEGRAEGRPGRLALGLTDKDGRFKLTTYENDDGAIIGKHTATVGLNFNESTGRDGNQGFPCRNSSKEVTVERGMGEIKLDF